ncbi:N-acetyl-gamma-glutamyl-phosphate reductase [Terribacillus saccharophilus]|uniref:N-acetyl-gamma-glutamyl-phosphate reductase n=1 Tax=Terribacillus saccharophilus TaxID=361277 RepID=UPI0039821DC8
MKVAIIGGTGYGAVELLRLLHIHPYAEVQAIISHSSAGKSLTSLYPHTDGFIEGNMETFDVAALKEKVDFAFFAAPPGVSRDLLPPLADAGIRCVDLAGDFRLKDPSVYKRWYNEDPAPPQLLEKAVYGLPEWNKSSIAEADFVANPGCYPTASLLGLLPAVHNSLINPASIIIDAKSGLSGAGKSPSAVAHYSEINENMKAYKLGTHKHIPEIEQLLAEAGGAAAQPISFSTQLVPMTRGIMATIYADLQKDITETELLESYKNYYSSHPFVRLRQLGEWPATKEVATSNFCDIGLYLDKRTNRMTVVSVIDNLVKGAAGQAIQNMNIMQGWEQTTGLWMLPVYP